MACGVDELELKDRVALIARMLRLYLPKDYSESIRILLQILGPENQEETGSFNKGYWLMPVARFAEDYGLESPDLSLDFIEEVTKRNTGEYAIRPFLQLFDVFVSSRQVLGVVVSGKNA